MRSSFKKPVLALLSLMMVLAMLAGCQTAAPTQPAASNGSGAASANPTGAAPATAALDPAQLKIILFADKKVDVDYIWGKVGEYAKDKLNATFTTTCCVNCRRSTRSAMTSTVSDIEATSIGHSKNSMRCIARSPWRRNAGHRRSGWRTAQSNKKPTPGSSAGNRCDC